MYGSALHYKLLDKLVCVMARVSRHGGGDGGDAVVDAVISVLAQFVHPSSGRRSNSGDDEITPYPGAVAVCDVDDSVMRPEEVDHAGQAQTQRVSNKQGACWHTRLCTLKKP